MHFLNVAFSKTSETFKDFSLDDTNLSTFSLKYSLCCALFFARKDWRYFLMLLMHFIPLRVISLTRLFSASFFLSSHSHARPARIREVTETLLGSSAEIEYNNALMRERERPAHARARETRERKRVWLTMEREAEQSRVMATSVAGWSESLGI